MSKTAMQQLRDKLQDKVDNLEDVLPNTDQYGYRSALEAVIDEIDDNMLPIEEKNINDAWYNGNRNPCTPLDFKPNYYNQTY